MVNSNLEVRNATIYVPLLELLYITCDLDVSIIVDTNTGTMLPLESPLFVANKIKLKTCTVLCFVSIYSSVF